MPNLANATLIGHLGRDPETRTTASGTVTFKATLAVNTGYGQNKVTTWWNVTVFGKKAEALERFNFVKGVAVGFIGEPSVREYTDKDGNKRFSADLIANDFVLLGDRADNAERPEAKPVSVEPKQATEQAPFNDDIPW